MMEIIDAFLADGLFVLAGRVVLHASLTDIIGARNMISLERKNE